MIVNAKTFPKINGKHTGPQHTLPVVAFYHSLVRFNKYAAALIGLPKKLAFDPDSLHIVEDPADGFEVTLSKSWKEHVIYSRGLSSVFLRKYGANKVIMQVETSPLWPEVYRLKLLSTGYDGDRNGTTQNDEAAAMLQSGLL